MIECNTFDCYLLQMIRVAKTFTHEKFDPDGLLKGSDIALLKLEESSKQQPIGLPDPKSDFGPGKRFLAIGWGSEGNEPVSGDLKQAHLSFVPWRICEKEWKGLSQSVLCAWEPDADACQGGKLCHSLISWKAFN